MVEVVRQEPCCPVGHDKQQVHHLRMVQLVGGPRDGNDWHLVCACCTDRHEHG